MMFCPDCGSLLKRGFVDGSKIVFCSCGFKKLSDEDFVLKESSKPLIEQKLFVFDVDPLATENHVCSKCGCKKALLVGSKFDVHESCRECRLDRPAFVCGCCGFKEFIE